MKCFKLIVLLFGISHCNNSSDLIRLNASVCDVDVDVDVMHYYAIDNYKQYEPLNAFTNTNTNTNNILDLAFVFFIMCSSFACSVVLVSNYVYSSMIN